MEIRTANKIRKIGKILFLLYMLAVVYLMFFFEKYVLKNRVNLG